MNNLEVLKKLREQLDHEFYCWNHCEEVVYTSYQQELADTRGIVLPPKPEPIYDSEDTMRNVRHLSKMLRIYEKRESNN